MNNMDYSSLPFYFEHVYSKENDYIQVTQVGLREKLNGHRGDWFLHENGNIYMFTIDYCHRENNITYHQILEYNQIPKNIIEKLSNSGYTHKN